MHTFIWKCRQQGGAGVTTVQEQISGAENEYRIVDLLEFHPWIDLSPGTGAGRGHKTLSGPPATGT